MQIVTSLAILGIVGISQLDLCCTASESTNSSRCYPGTANTSLPQIDSSFFSFTHRMAVEHVNGEVIGGEVHRLKNLFQCHRSVPRL